MSTFISAREMMVSGATGYVAGWLIKRLLEDGHHVHAAVRDPANEQKLAHLECPPGRLTRQHYLFCRRSAHRRILCRGDGGL